MYVLECICIERAGDLTKALVPTYKFLWQMLFVLQ